MKNFEFTTNAVGSFGEIVYLAIELYNGDFIVLDKDSVDEPHCLCTKWSKDKVEHNIESGWWRIKEELKFSIKKGNIESAARFIIGYNKYMYSQSIDDMVNSITAHIKDMIEDIKNGKDVFFSSTLGYTILINQDGVNDYVIEVLVNPSVSSDEEFVYVDELFDKE